MLSKIKNSAYLTMVFVILIFICGFILYIILNVFPNNKEQSKSESSQNWQEYQMDAPDLSTLENGKYISTINQKRFYYFSFSHPSGWELTEYSGGQVSIKKTPKDKNVIDYPWIAIMVKYVPMPENKDGNNLVFTETKKVVIKGLEGMFINSELFQRYYLKLPDGSGYIYINQTRRSAEADLVLAKVLNSFELNYVELP